MPALSVTAGRLLRVVALAAVCAAGALEAQQPVVNVPRVSRPPVLEDYVGGAPENGAARITGFRQREPGDGTPVSQDTAAYLSYDDKNLYIIFVCADDPAQIRGRLVKREVLDGEDMVAVVLDTFRDGQRGYVFMANPLGIQRDGIVAEGRDDDYSFDTLWHSQGRLTDSGYIVWMAIPFKSLRFHNDQKPKWGIALARAIVRNNETSFWPYLTRRITSFTDQMAELEGLEGISPGRNLQFIPYAAASRARFLNAGPTGPPAFETGNSGRVGLDAKAVFRDALTLDVALNPDFSQVESDEPQVTTNQRYEVFFPEKRPFFVENAGFFATNENLFFSRRIIDPEFGARLTGKVGKWAIGVLAADDRAPGALLPAGDANAGERAVIGVASVRREFSSGTHLGLLATSRDFGPEFNRVVSLQGRARLASNWYASGQWIRSFDGEAGRRQRSGQAFNAGLDYSSRRAVFSTVYVDRGPDFRSALGFIPRVDIREVTHSGRYRWFPERRRLLSLGPRYEAIALWNHAGQLQDWKAEFNFDFEFRGQTQLSFEREAAYERFLGLGFRKQETAVEFSTNWLKWLGIQAELAREVAVNYHPALSPAGPLDPFAGPFTKAELRVSLVPTPRLRIENTYLYSRLGVDRGRLAAPLQEAASVFNDHVARSKVNFQFSRRLSLRAIVDYYGLLPNQRLLAEEKTKRLTGDVLFTYLVNPGTALYVGYTDYYDNLELFAQDGATRLRRTRHPGMSTGRQVFVKLSYLFRF